MYDSEISITLSNLTLAFYSRSGMLPIHATNIYLSIFFFNIRRKDNEHSPSINASRNTLLC